MGKGNGKRLPAAVGFSQQEVTGGAVIGDPSIAVFVEGQPAYPVGGGVIQRRAYGRTCGVDGKPVAWLPLQQSLSKRPCPETAIPRVIGDSAEIEDVIKNSIPVAVIVGPAVPIQPVEPVMIIQGGPAGIDAPGSYPQDAGSPGPAVGSGWMIMAPVGQSGGRIGNVGLEVERRKVPRPTNP